MQVTAANGERHVFFSADKSDEYPIADDMEYLQSKQIKVIS